MSKGKIALFFILTVVGVLLITNATRTFISEYKNITLQGNGKEYDLENVDVVENSPLQGMNILYLGSSVTNGSASRGISFVDYISKRNGAIFVKEAVNGTTLVDGRNSYIQRLMSVDDSIKFDLVICQLSTNDATRGEPIGYPIVNGNPDTSTVSGAIEYIIGYVKKTWGCPVVFYTGSYYESEAYSNMVDILNKISELYDVGVIDLYTDSEFNDISDEERALYMADPIHPTKAGYLLWWTPKMEEYLYQFISDKG